MALIGNMIVRKQEAHLCAFYMNAHFSKEMMGSVSFQLVSVDEENDSDDDESPVPWSGKKRKVKKEQAQQYTLPTRKSDSNLDYDRSTRR